MLSLLAFGSLQMNAMLTLETLKTNTINKIGKVIGSMNLKDLEGKGIRFYGHRYKKIKATEALFINNFNQAYSGRAFSTEEEEDSFLENKTQYAGESGRHECLPKNELGTELQKIKEEYLSKKEKINQYLVKKKGKIHFFSFSEEE